MSPESTEHHRDHQGDRAPGLSAEASAWDKRYSENAWSTEPDTALITLVGSLAPGKALDLGCGPGRNAIWLARKGWEVTGVDASSVGLAQADSRAHELGVTLTLVKADLLTYEPPPGTYDLVVVANIHFDPSERQRFFTGAAAALAPGGHLFVVGHHRDSFGRTGPPDPERLFTESVLADLFPGLDIERLERHERPANAGEEPIVDAFVWAVVPAPRA